MDGMEPNRLDRIGVWTVVDGVEHATPLDAGLGSSALFSVMFTGELWESPIMGVAITCAELDVSVGGATDTGVKKGRGLDGLVVWGEVEVGVVSC